MKGFLRLWGFLKETEVNMITPELTVDLSLHRKLGITVLTSKQVKGRHIYEGAEEWSEDELFEPAGVTFEECREAIKRCKGEI